MPTVIATLKCIAADKKGAIGRATHLVASEPDRLLDAVMIVRERSPAY